MPRSDISMTDAEVDGLLAGWTQMVVGTIDVDGWPVATLASTRYDAGSLTVTCRPGDPLPALLADVSAVCCVYDEHATYSEIRGVILHGRATPTGGEGAFTVDADRVVSFDFGRIRR